MIGSPYGSDLSRILRIRKILDPGSPASRDDLTFVLTVDKCAGSRFEVLLLPKILISLRLAFYDGYRIELYGT